MTVINIDMYFTKYPLIIFETILNNHLSIKSEQDNNKYILNVKREYLKNKIMISGKNHTVTYEIANKNDINEITNIFDAGIDEILKI